MEEQKDKAGEHGWWCAWGHGPHGHWHPGFLILRIVIAIVILVVVFAIGVKLGELRASFYYAGYDSYGYGYGPGMMGGYGQGYGYGGYPSMMRGYGGYGQYGAPMMPYYYGSGAATSTAK